MRAILLSLALLFSTQTIHAEETTLQSQHIYDCIGVLSGDEIWIEKDLRAYAEETGIQIFVMARSSSSNDKRCVDVVKKGKSLTQEKNIVLLTLIAAKDSRWIEATLTTDLTRRFGLTSVIVNLGHEKGLFLEEVMRTGIIETLDLIRNHFSSMAETDATTVRQNNSPENDIDPYGSDVTAPLEGTAPIEPSDIPPDEGDGPEQSDTPKPFQQEGQPI